MRKYLGSTYLLVAATFVSTVTAQHNGTGTATQHNGTGTVAPHNGSGAASKCPMTCSHGGTCILGTADYSNQPAEPNGTPFLFLQETSRDGWFCNCTAGWTGIHCARPYTICPGKKGETGDPHMCYHGGMCIEDMEDHANISSSQRFCDCSAAFHDGIPYFGQFCELEGAVRCAPDSEVFCTSGGTCVEGFEEKAHPCTCPEGHRGPHCEFLRGQLPECVLQCQNKGECALGLRKEYQTVWSTHDGNFQYCVSTIQYNAIQYRSYSIHWHHWHHRVEILYVSDMICSFYTRIPFRHVPKAGLAMLVKFQESNAGKLTVLMVEHVSKLSIKMVKKRMHVIASLPITMVKPTQGNIVRQ
jgi:hypothetical protein